MAAKKEGLYANINKKRKRIAKGSGEKMRQPGEEGAPKKGAFKESAKTAQPVKKKAAAAKKKSPAKAKPKTAKRKAAK